MNISAKSVEALAKHHDAWTLAASYIDEYFTNPHIGYYTLDDIVRHCTLLPSSQNFIAGAASEAGKAIRKKIIERYVATKIMAYIDQK
jgi:hypothetical protein